VTGRILESEGVAVAVIDALASHICIVDPNGMIVAVNRAWQKFAAENSAMPNQSSVGTCYLDICERAYGLGSEEAGPFGSGLRSVLEGRTEMFEMEYPCHSPTENRWFLGNVTPLRTSLVGAVISHMKITDRKLLELELKKLAEIDPLTDLPNRRYFFEVGQQEFEGVRRFGVPSSLVMIDLDHFKVINDTYGHDVGDETLRRVSHIFKAALRQIDVVARLGGEEFVVVLPGADETAATTFAEKLRCSVRDTPIKIDQHQFSVTASFGVAEMAVRDLKFDECVSRADAAMYRAKRAGRNRVENFEVDPIRGTRGL
jgi:diguanylate cyclase (GGDEF)-like protein